MKHTDEIMRLADAYADHAYNDGVLRLDRADDRTAASRAALEAAVLAQGEPVYRLLDWIINECVIYPESDDEKQFAKRLLDAITHPKSGYTHPAPVNQQLLADAKRYRWLLERIYKDGGDLCAQVPMGYDNFGMDIDAAVDAAIAAAEGKV